jgi:hypothetical protein
MLRDAILRWAACAGFTTGEACRLQWSDLGVIVGLYLVVDAALSLCTRWWRALQVLQAGSFTPAGPADRNRMSLCREYPDDDLSHNRNAA